MIDAALPVRRATMSGAAPIGLIAGAGDLPVEAAQELRRQGREVLVVTVDGTTDRDYPGFACETVAIGAIGRLIDVLQAGGCRQVILLGTFRRPNFAEIKWDLGAFKALSRVMKLRFGGDNQAVNGIVSLFEAQGFEVIGPRQVLAGLLAPAGTLGQRHPSRPAMDDVVCGMRAIAHMGALDVGQAVVVAEQRVVAVEAAEGTTEMIERVAGLRRSGRLAPRPPSGVLVKATKPDQETRLDLPVVGPETVDAAVRSGLEGIAFEARGVLLVGRAEIVRRADAAGLFVVGVPAAPAAGPAGT